MKRRRELTKGIVTRRKRVVKYIDVTKEVFQCERPYVLFGVAVRAARRDADMTQAELAKKIGLVRTSVVNIECGRQRVLLSDLFDFAKALRVNPKVFFEAVQK